jgi:hypothetical protein
MTAKKAEPPKVFTSIAGIGGPVPSAASPVQTESPAQVGRPPGSTEIDYTDMDALIGYRYANQSHFTQKVLISLIQHLYAEKTEKDPPGITTIKERIAQLKAEHK